MSAAVRSYRTAGAALVGAGVVTAAQIVSPVHESQTRVVERAVSLAAAAQACSGYHVDGCDIWAPQSYTAVTLNPNGAIRNIPANLVNAIVSIPRTYLDALNDLSYGLEVTGSWWVYTPTNVLGFDPADEPKFAGLVNLLIPFKPLSNPIAESITWWAKANLTMNEGCTGDTGPVCPDPNALLKTMFQVPIWNLNTGFYFPKVNDPVSAAEGAIGNPIPGSTGAEVPWSKAFVQMNPFDLESSVLNYLMADPSTNRPAPITFAEVASTLKRFAAAVKLDFYPFVPMSFLLKGWPYTALTPLFKPFLPVLCPDCNPYNPAWPSGWVPPPAPFAATKAAAARRAVQPTAAAAAAVQTVSDTVGAANADPSPVQAAVDPKGRTASKGVTPSDLPSGPVPAGVTDSVSETPGPSTTDASPKRRGSQRTAKAASARAERSATAPAAAGN